jgi:hypothetical protein
MTSLFFRKEKHAREFLQNKSGNAISLVYNDAEICHKISECFLNGDETYRHVFDYVRQGFIVYVKSPEGMIDDRWNRSGNDQ